MKTVQPKSRGRPEPQRRRHGAGRPPAWLASSPVVAAQAERCRALDVSDRVAAQRTVQRTLAASARVVEGDPRAPARGVPAPAQEGPGPGVLQRRVPVPVVQRQGAGGVVQRNGDRDALQARAATVERTYAALHGIVLSLRRLCREAPAVMKDAEPGLVKAHGDLEAGRREVAAVPGVLEADPPAEVLASLARQVEAHAGKVLELLGTLQQQATAAARQAHEADDAQTRDALLGVVGDALGARRALGDEGAVPFGEARPRGKDTAHYWLLDVPASVNDALVGLGSGGAAVGDMAAAGTVLGSGSTAMTAIGAVAGSLGVVFGAIAVGLGVHAWRRGAAKEAELGELVEGGLEAPVEHVATYAKEKKRKKKWGGAMTATLGTGAAIAGILGLVALGAATMGLGAAILGIGMAAAGLAVVFGKFIHKRRKRKAFAARIDALANQLVEEARGDQGEAAAEMLRAWEVEPTADDAAPKTATVLRERVHSTRDLMAARLLALLTGPPSAAAFDAERVVRTLGLDPEALRRKVVEDAPATAQDRIAAKMQSW